jgi:putative endonuclease
MVAGTSTRRSDLIAWQGELLCVIEVKTRTAHDMTPAEAAVDEHKRKMVRRLARQYVRQLPMELPPQVRFDVISVYLVPGQPIEFVHLKRRLGGRMTVTGVEAIAGREFTSLFG